MVSIPACHAGDRGSIPRRGGHYFVYQPFEALIEETQPFRFVERCKKSKILSREADLNHRPKDVQFPFHYSPRFSFFFFIFLPTELSRDLSYSLKVRVLIVYLIKWKTKYTTLLEQFQNPIEKSQKETHSIILTHKYMTCLSTDTSIKSGGVKLVLWAQTSPLSEMMRSCKCFPRMSRISTNCWTEWSLNK